MIITKQGCEKHWSICCPPRPESLWFHHSSFIMLPPVTFLMHPLKKIIMPLPSPAFPLSHRLMITRTAPVLVILCLPDLILPGRKTVTGQRGPREWLAAKIQHGYPNTSLGLWCQFSALLLPCISAFSSGKLGWEGLTYLYQESFEIQMRLYMKMCLTNTMGSIYMEWKIYCGE